MDIPYLALTDSFFGYHSALTGMFHTSANAHSVLQMLKFLKFPLAILFGFINLSAPFKPMDDIFILTVHNERIADIAKTIR